MELWENFALFTEFFNKNRSKKRRIFVILYIKSSWNFVIKYIKYAWNFVMTKIELIKSRKIQCTQICINPKKKSKISIDFMAFRFVL